MIWGKTDVLLTEAVLWNFDTAGIVKSPSCFGLERKSKCGRITVFHGEWLWHNGCPESTECSLYIYGTFTIATASDVKSHTIVIMLIFATVNATSFILILHKMIGYLSFFLFHQCSVDYFLTVCYTKQHTIFEQLHGVQLLKQKKRRGFN